MNKILVTGASGHLGEAVANFLLKKTSVNNIAVLVRDSESDKAKTFKAKGIEVRKGDYNDYNSLVNAFKGIDKLYFVSGNDIVNRNKQQENVVKASKEAGVKHVLYTSIPRKKDSNLSPIALVAESHIKTENWLKESGLTYTLLKHNIYMDMLPIFLGEKLLETGVAYFPAGDGKVGFALRNDMAEAAAAILTSEGHENKSYDITNNRAVSFLEIAAAISKASGKTINYVSPAQEEFIKTLSSAGVPMEYVGMFAGFGEVFKQGELDQTNNLLETLIDRKPTSVTEFLTQVYSNKN
jgi:NAD(P)H dehydrogenase (quinone)